MRKRLFYLFDLIVVALAPFLAVAIRGNFTPTTRQLLDVMPFAVTGVCIAAVVFIVAGTHRGIWRYVSMPDFSRIIIATAITLLVTIFVMFSFDRLDRIARSLPLIQWVLMVAGMISARIIARAIFARQAVRRTGRDDADREHVLVVGLNHVAELYLRCVASLASNKICVAGLVDESAVMKGRLLHHHKVLGQPEELSQILAVLNVHGVNVKRIVITTPFQELSKSSRDELLKLERSSAIKLDLFEERLGFADGSGSSGSSRGSKERLERPGEQFSAIDPYIQLENREGLFIKRVVDFAGALVLMVAFLPISLFVSLLVALDVGLPLTFWQERPGKAGRPFRIYKFRTMRSAHNEDGSRIPDERRQSRLGYFLRRIRFDELPQLYHILVGEMSFVGPRPLLPVDLPENGSDLIQIRSSIRPGLTGWAQINGGKAVSIDDKAVLDVWYVKNRSLALDIKIILGTIDMVIRGERFNEQAVQAAYNDLGLTRQEVLFQESVVQERDPQIKTANTIILQEAKKLA